MNNVTPVCEQDEVSESLEKVDRLVFALDEAVVNFCDVAFAPYASTDFYDALTEQGYEEPDLISAHSLSIYLLLHRDHVTSCFRKALLNNVSTGSTVDAHEDVMKRIHGITLQKAASRLLGSLHTNSRHSNHQRRPRTHPTSLDLADVTGDLLLCVATLDSMGAFCPIQDEIDAPTCALFILCLHHALITEMSIADELPALVSF